METLCFIPMFNSYDLMDRVLVANGVKMREFRTCKEVKTALSAIGIPVDQIEQHIENLNEGWILELDVSAEEYACFFGTEAPNREFTGLIQ